MDYSRMDINALNREENKLKTRYNSIEDDCVKRGVGWNEFQELVHDEAEGLYFISKYKRLLQDPVVEYGKEWKGDTYTLEQFKNMALNKELIDEDGIGYYATESAKSDVEILPSDVIENLIREDFSHVIWFNR